MPCFGMLVNLQTTAFNSRAFSFDYLHEGTKRGKTKQGSENERGKHKKTFCGPMQSMKLCRFLLFKFDFQAFGIVVYLKTF